MYHSASNIAATKAGVSCKVLRTSLTLHKAAYTRGQSGARNQPIMPRAFSPTGVSLFPVAGKVGVARAVVYQRVRRLRTKHALDAPCVTPRLRRRLGCGRLVLTASKWPRTTSGASTYKRGGSTSGAHSQPTNAAQSARDATDTSKSVQLGRAECNECHPVRLV